MNVPIDTARLREEILAWMSPPPGDAGALRDALRRVLDDAPLRASLVAAGAGRAAEFSLDRLAERFIDVYETAIALGP